MQLGQWQFWMDQDRDYKARLKPSYNAHAAALITGSTPEEAEKVKHDTYIESRAYTSSQNWFQHAVYSFMKSLPAQHAVGTIALYFVPYIGPLLGTLAQAATPMVDAASKEAIAEKEAGRVSRRFREEYYTAMDAYLKGQADIPASYLEYHAAVIAPAALDVKAQIKAGKVKTATGVYTLDQSGIALFKQSKESTDFEVYGGVFDRTMAYKNQLVSDMSRQPSKVLMGVLAGVLVGVAASFALQEA